MAGGGTGRDSEEKVCSLLPGSCVVRNKKCDVLWYECSIEVKGPDNYESICKNLNLNQIRPTKYNVVVADLSKHDHFSVDFVVYPPNYLVKRGVIYKGQHTDDGVRCQCITLSPNSNDLEIFGCFIDELPDRIEQAYIEGEKDTKTKEFAIKRKEMYEKMSIIDEENKKFAEDQDLKECVRKYNWQRATKIKEWGW